MKGAKSKIIPFPEEMRKVVERVHATTENSDKIQWTDHARERMEEREITSRQVLETLRRGGSGSDYRNEKMMNGKSPWRNTTPEGESASWEE